MKLLFSLWTCRSCTFHLGEMCTAVKRSLKTSENNDMGQKVQGMDNMDTDGPVCAPVVIYFVPGNKLPTFFEPWFPAL